MFLPGITSKETSGRRLVWGKMIDRLVRTEKDGRGACVWGTAKLFAARHNKLRMVCNICRNFFFNLFSFDLNLMTKLSLSDFINTKLSQTLVDHYIPEDMSQQECTLTLLTKYGSVIVTATWSYVGSITLHSLSKLIHQLTHSAKIVTFLQTNTGLNISEAKKLRGFNTTCCTSGHSICF